MTFRLLEFSCFSSCSPSFCSAGQLWAAQSGRLLWIRLGLVPDKKYWLVRYRFDLGRLFLCNAGSSSPANYIAESAVPAGPFCLWLLSVLFCLDMSRLNWFELRQASRWWTCFGPIHCRMAVFLWTMPCTGRIRTWTAAGPTGIVRRIHPENRGQGRWIPYNLPGLPDRRPVK